MQGINLVSTNITFNEKSFLKIDYSVLFLVQYTIRKKKVNHNILHHGARATII
jgi:hypothetical protein